MNPKTNIFFIVGGQRCGTTWLLSQLANHPQVLPQTPILPEPKFFIQENALHIGKDYYLNHFFPNRTGDSFLCDKSTSYLEVKGTAERINSMFPDSKIIISLRNPVYRAISNYFFSKMHGLETRSITEVFLQNKPAPNLSKKLSVNPFDYLGRGIYIHYLTEYMRFFGKERLKIILYEDMLVKEAVFDAVFEFLGIGKYPQFKISDLKENDSLYDEVIPNAVLDILNDFYKPFNQNLESLTKINLNAWEIKQE